MDWYVFITSILLKTGTNIPTYQSDAVTNNIAVSVFQA